jgi:hypothetical protein
MSSWILTSSLLFFPDFALHFQHCSASHLLLSQQSQCTSLNKANQSAQHVPTLSDMSTAQDLISDLLQIRAEREELDAREAFIKEQLQGAMALGEMDGYQTDDGTYEFGNARYVRCERNSYKHSKQAEAAIRTIKERDIDAGLAQRNVTIYFRLHSLS